MKINETQSLTLKFPDSTASCSSLISFFLELVCTTVLLTASLPFASKWPPCLTEAPYPACSTAAIIFSSESTSSRYSTCILLVSKLTVKASTPSSFATLFSTRAEQAPHVIPVTSNFCFFIMASLLKDLQSISLIFGWLLLIHLLLHHSHF